MEKLKCVIVDDDATSVQILSDFCGELPYIDVAGRFHDSLNFIKLMPTLDFDLCLVNLTMKQANGIEVARKLDGKPVIFLARGERMLLSAIDMEPVSIVRKPLNKDKVYSAISRAYSQIITDRIALRKAQEDSYGYALFSNGERGKIRIKLSDIVYVFADKRDTRNKHIIMKDGSSYMTVECPFNRLRTLSPGLIKINKSEMVSIGEVEKMERDRITLYTPINKNGVRQVTLARTYRNEFKRLLKAS
jgi:DNA-binding LytR/AlgR family response regulator